MKYALRLLKKLVPTTKINSVVDKKAKIENGSTLIDSSIDRYSFFGRNCQIINTQIGAFCSIAGNVKIGLGNHPITWVSTSCAFYEGRDSIKKDLATLNYDSSANKTVIGSDVWIGENAIIPGGITIGTGAIIGSGAVVTKDVEPYSIVGGCPAKLIRKRFDDATVEALLKSQWWLLPEERLKEISHAMNNPEEFLKLINTGKD